jgi:ABC-type Na+ efflux pump permease subunit
MENDKNISDKIIKEARAAKNQVKDKIVSLIAAAFGLVAALAWNDAVKSLIDYLFPVSNGGLIAKFIYALGVTILAVLLVYYLERIFAKKEEKA